MQTSPPDKVEPKERTTWFFTFRITYGLFVGVRNYKCTNCHVPLVTWNDCKAHALWHVRNLADERGAPMDPSRNEGRPQTKRIKIVRAMHGGLELVEE